MIDNLASQNVIYHCIYDKLYRSHAHSELLVQVVVSIMCTQPKFNTQMLKIVAIKYISAALKQVIDDSAG